MSFSDLQENADESRPDAASAGLDARRRRILYRAWHRGMREMDIVMGRFVESEIVRFSEDELEEIERLIEVPDDRFFSWVTGRVPVPPELDSPLLRRLIGFDRRPV